MTSDPQQSCSALGEAKKTLQLLLISHEDKQSEDLSQGGSLDKSEFEKTQWRKVKELLSHCGSLDKSDRINLLMFIAAEHASDLSKQFVKESTGINTQDGALQLPSSMVFERIAASEGGLKFMLDLRTDLLAHLKKVNDLDEIIMFEQMSSTLKTLFSNWFSVSSLQLDRVTLDSSPEQLLERVGALEAVHPVRDQAELEARVGNYRRCFVFTHPGLLGEPLVIFHVALTEEIKSSLSDLIARDTERSSQKQDEEELERIKAAMFYSISSTQPGLAGLGLASHLIEGSVARLLAEFPSLETFATLSPIPGFRSWLLELLTKKLLLLTKKEEEVVTVEEAAVIEATLGAGEPHLLLLTLLKSISHLPDNKDLAKLRPVVCRLAARYLCLEKKRWAAAALNPVANFHLSNGATVWRINWMADVSLKGMDASFGLMVNYRYFLDR